jgi:zinc transporter, ZIP family
MSLSPVMAGALGSLAAGMATALGALPLLFMKPPSEERQGVMLGFAAGVMLAASFFSLIIPGVDVLREGGMNAAGSAGVMGGAVLLGATAVGLLNRFVTVDHMVIGRADIPQDRVRRIWLFVLAITFHNFPEGMAVGVSFGGGDMKAGAATAFGIGVQNMPEGLAVAASFASLGYGRWVSFLGGMASGLVEPVGGLFGVSVVSALPALLPWGLGLAAGAMIYVVTAEIIPQTQENRRSERAIVGLMVGLVAMMFLDIALG